MQVSLTGWPGDLAENLAGVSLWKSWQHKLKLNNDQNRKTKTSAVILGLQHQPDDAIFTMSSV